MLSNKGLKASTDWALMPLRITECLCLCLSSTSLVSSLINVRKWSLSGAELGSRSGAGMGFWGGEEVPELEDSTATWEVSV